MSRRARARARIQWPLVPGPDAGGPRNITSPSRVADAHLHAHDSVPGSQASKKFRPYPWVPGVFSPWGSLLQSRQVRARGGSFLLLDWSSWNISNWRSFARVVFRFFSYLPWLLREMNNPLFLVDGRNICTLDVPGRFYLNDASDASAKVAQTVRSIETSVEPVMSHTCF